ncbi:PEPxxWA-CTERM sorting domain-containing protein [Bradyrhizobium sp.]
MPEPSTWAMMIIGLASICLLSRRRPQHLGI